MKKLSIVFMCLAIIFSLVACSNNVKFTKIENKTILATDGTEYTFVGNEGRVWCFGELEFIGHVQLTPRIWYCFRHKSGTSQKQNKQNEQTKTKRSKGGWQPPSAFTAPTFCLLLSLWTLSESLSAFLFVYYPDLCYFVEKNRIRGERSMPGNLCEHRRFSVHSSTSWNKSCCVILSRSALH